MNGFKAVSSFTALLFFSTPFASFAAVPVQDPVRPAPAITAGTAAARPLTASEVTPGDFFSAGPLTAAPDKKDASEPEKPAVPLEHKDNDKKETADPVTQWNHLTLEAIRLNNTTPPEAARILAIVHSAVLDALNAVKHKPGRYVTVKAAHGSSPEAAAAAAAWRVLSHFFPSQQSLFDSELNAELAAVKHSKARAGGKKAGLDAADALLALRNTDGYDAVVTYPGGTDAGAWQPTPPANAPALLPQWGKVKPFVIPETKDFFPKGPPALTSQEWADAFNEVKGYGADFHQVPPGAPLKEETQIALFWSDGKGTYTPPGHWNQIAEVVAADRKISLYDKARLFAELNTALADAAILCWDVKYTDGFWRPITAIRSADADGNPQTAADPNWTPLIPTPPFPEYVSGHSTFSGAAAAVLTNFFGDNVHFTVGSITSQNLVRSFTSFDQAAEEAGMSRVYGGIHYRFSSQDGLDMGRKVGEAVVNAFHDTRIHGVKNGETVHGTIYVHPNLRILKKVRKVAYYLNGKRFGKVYEAPFLWGGPEGRGTQGYDTRVLKNGDYTLTMVYTDAEGDHEETLHLTVNNS